MKLKRTSPEEVYTQLERYDVDPPGAHRTEEMKVLVLGMSRTGTMSMYVALRKLGYNTYHFLETSLNRANEHHKLWTEALNAKYYNRGKEFQGEDFDKMLWSYQAITDAPCCLFVDELIAAYPNAKVILTTRDAETWVKSFESSFGEILSFRFLFLLELFDRDLSYVYWPLLRMIARIWGKGDYTNRDAQKQSFLEHNAHVRSVVPKEKLLEFKLGDGWEPLCEFLGETVPPEPFPHANEGRMAALAHYPVYWRQWRHVRDMLAPWGVLSAVAVGLAWCLRSSIGK